MLTFMVKQLRFRQKIFFSKFTKMSRQFFSRLSQNYIEILDDEEHYDITIEVGKDPNVRIFRAHMIILCYRSPFLRRTLVFNKKKNNVLTHVKLQNISPEIFQISITFIYTFLNIFYLNKHFFKQ